MLWFGFAVAATFLCANNALNIGLDIGLDNDAFAAKCGLNGLFVRSRIYDLFVENYVLEDEATLNGTESERLIRINNFIDFLNNTFYTDDAVQILSGIPIIGKENILSGSRLFVSNSIDIRHTNGLLQYKFISCNEIQIRETHRTIGYLPDFASFPPSPQYFRGDDVVKLTFVRINGKWKVNLFESLPRQDADML